MFSLSGKQDFGFPSFFSNQNTVGFWMTVVGNTGRKLTQCGVGKQYSFIPQDVYQAT